MKLFAVTYSYRVSENEVDRYIGIQKRVREIYLERGCIGYEVFKGDDGLWFEINRFRDREHYENVKKSLDSDPRIEALWKEFCSIVDKEEITTRKYEKIL